MKTDFKEKAKNIILTYQDSDYDIEFVIAKILNDDYLDLKQDKDFLISIIESKWSWKRIHYFVEFFQKSAYSIKEYADIVFKLCSEVVNSDNIDPGSFWYQ